ncbi:hypothetical protein Gpo141_00005937 [Globisporangium polare]
MDDRLALRQAPLAHPDAGGGALHELEENEDEKVYYGFGVFMGLPLADLKAMKEDYLQKQALGGEFRAALPSSAGVGAGAARGPPLDYDAPRGALPGGRVAPSDYSNGHGGGGVSGVVPPLAPLPNGHGGHPMAAHPGQARYGVSMGAPHGAIGRAYDASHDDDNEELSDDGSDGSYSAPKSHSLNFILH